MMTSSREIEMQAAAPATAGYVALASFPETDPASRHSPRPTRARGSDDVSPGTTRGTDSWTRLFVGSSSGLRSA